MRGQHGPELVVAAEDLDNAGGEEFLGDFDAFESAVGGEGGGLDDDCAAGDQGRGDFVEGEDADEEAVSGSSLMNPRSVHEIVHSQREVLVLGQHGHLYGSQSTYPRRNPTAYTHWEVSRSQHLRVVLDPLDRQLQRRQRINRPLNDIHLHSRELLRSANLFAENLRQLVLV